MQPVSDMIAVIRCAGERTVDTCRMLLEEQVPPSQVFVAGEYPFEATLRRTYEIGLESNARWLMSLDADVLLRRGGVACLLAEAERMPRHAFQIEGLVFDKLTGTLRRAGQRIYRVELLPHALDLIPGEGMEIRPEMATLEKMEAEGFPSLRAGVALGVHDFEQFYRDLYRKAFLHAHKHVIWLSPFVERWRTGATTDVDFVVALRGLADGLSSPKTSGVDARAYAARASAALDQLGLTEKRPLQADEWGSAKVDELLSTAPATDPDQVSEVETMGVKLVRARERCRSMGLPRFAAFVAGSLLSDLGGSLKSMSAKDRR
jgi:hypothetical protein